MLLLCVDENFFCLYVFVYIIDKFCINALTKNKFDPIYTFFTDVCFIIITNQLKLILAVAARFDKKKLMFLEFACMCSSFFFFLFSSCCLFMFSIFFLILVNGSSYTYTHIDINAHLHGALLFNLCLSVFFFLCRKNFLCYLTKKLFVCVCVFLNIRLEMIKIFCSNGRI
jgi:hypothetical protein